MSKPSMSINDQIDQLTARGLRDSSRELQRALVDHGYFRLSGYWRYLQIDPVNGENNFVEGANFSDVYDIYQIDAQLRNLLLEGMAEVEIALRSILTANICHAGKDGVEYLDQATYDGTRVDNDGRNLRVKLLADMRSDIDRSKERHVRHYRLRAPEAVPFWVATEAFSFGILSRLYGLLSDESCRIAIAKRFGYPKAQHFGNNLRAVAVFRNVCAHHSRIWNRQINQDIPRIWSALIDKGLVEADYRNTPWGVIAVLADMVRSVRRDDSFKLAIAACVPSAGLYREGLLRPSGM